MDAKKILIECIKQELEDNFVVTLNKDITEEQLRDLYQLAKMHDLTHFIAKALNAELKNTKYNKIFDDSLYMAVYRYEQKRYVREQISKGFEKYGIPHIFLKGSVLCNYYSEPWMRTSCDIDVLVKETDLTKAIDVLVSETRCECGKKDSHDVSLYSREGVHIELHYDLIEVIDSAKSILSKVWETSSLTHNSKYEYMMTDEMFYFYHIAHMAKHFLHGGCGIRSLLDVWILNNAIPFEREKRVKLLEKGRLYAFAREVENLSKVWFGTQSHSQISCLLEEYIFDGGVYGNLKNKVTMQRSKGDSKVKFVIKRIFMPYKEMALEYPQLSKTPFLLPVFWLFRGFKCLDRKRMIHAINEFKLSNSVEKSKQEKNGELLEKLELEILNG